jgi:SAM-dependent methyltransferase
MAAFPAAPAAVASLTEILPAGGEVRAYYRRVLPFYDLELAGRGDEELWAWAARGCRVLELGAGTGRATAFLARTAERIVALEISLEMIALARQRLAEVPGVSLLAGDMREASLGARFDLVAAVDDPLVHLIRDEDRDRVFATVSRHLAPEGRFLLDAAWLKPEQRCASGSPWGFVKERSGLGDLRIRETWRCDPESRLCTASFEYRLRDQPIERASFPARLWSLDELAGRARAAGLQIGHLWGDYDRRPWDRATSPRLIAELRPQV